MEPTKPDGEEGDEDNTEENTVPDIAAQLIHRSLCHYPSTLYLNLYQNHFSYIKDLKKYAESYSCSRCGTLWKHVGKLNRHERTCEAKVIYQFPGGAYKTPPTNFQLLEDEGFTVPEYLKFFPYRATFDFECMFTPETDLNDTEKLTWNAKHVPLSVSVCSNVPDYDQPKCFVSDGDSKQLVKEMLEHLVKISEQSYDLLKKEFNFLFEAIDQKLQDLQQKSESCELSRHNKLEDSTQEDSDDEGEDLMDTDDEEEEIESETEEDRAFIDDDVEEQGASFYRALDREHEDQSENDHECVYHRPEDNSPEPKEKKVHPLKKLRDRFQQYLQELPVLGFNSGKYDLNAVKEFLFPILVQNEGVQFTIKRNHNFMCLKTPHLRLLDVTNFLAPGFSYDKFLKAYECPQTKRFFPYEWLDFLDKLFQGISIPGVTLTYLFTTLESGIFFSLFDEKNKDLYTLFKKNMVGGPSIIFHRYHEKDKTKI